MPGDGGAPMLLTRRVVVRARLTLDQACRDNARPAPRAGATAKIPSEMTGGAPLLVVAALLVVFVGHDDVLTEARARL